jgi:hypothetical protein
MIETFEMWEARARLQLAGRGIAHYDADPMMDDVRAHCAQSGQTPQEAFGTPEGFAAAAAAERPASDRGRADRHDMTAGDYVGGSVFVLTLALIPLSLFGAYLYGTWSLPLNPARVAGLLLMAAAFITCQAGPSALRAAGYPRLAPWAYAGTAVIVVAAAGAFVGLPKTDLGSIPVWGIIVVAALGLFAQTRPSKPPRTPAVRATTAPAATATDDPEHWFRRLDGLLVGRHDVPEARAAELVAEARAHLAAAGGPPTAEFGPVEEYAVTLADQEPVRVGPWWRGTTALILFALVQAGVLVRWGTGYWADDFRVVAVLCFVFAAVSLGYAIRLFRRHLRERRG